MNCAIPSAPAELTEPGWNSLSWYRRRMKNGAGRSLLCATPVRGSQISARVRGMIGFTIGASPGSTAGSGSETSSGIDGMTSTSGTSASAPGGGACPVSAIVSGRRMTACGSRATAVARELVRLESFSSERSGLVAVAEISRARQTSSNNRRMSFDPRTRKSPAPGAAFDWWGLSPLRSHILCDKTGQFCGPFAGGIGAREPHHRRPLKEKDLFDGLPLHFGKSVMRRPLYVPRAPENADAVLWVYLQQRPNLGRQWVAPKSSCSPQCH